MYVCVCVGGLRLNVLVAWWKVHIVPTKMMMWDTLWVSFFLPFSPFKMEKVATLFFCPLNIHLFLFTLFCFHQRLMEISNKRRPLSLCYPHLQPISPTFLQNPAATVKKKCLCSVIQRNELNYWDCSFIQTGCWGTTDELGRLINKTAFIYYRGCLASRHQDNFYKKKKKK